MLGFFFELSCWRTDAERNWLSVLLRELARTFARIMKRGRTASNSREHSPADGEASSSRRTLVDEGNRAWELAVEYALREKIMSFLREALGDKVYDARIAWLMNLSLPITAKMQANVQLLNQDGLLEILGSGGFGRVVHGTINQISVAVKMSNELTEEQILYGGYMEMWAQEVLVLLEGLLEAVPDVPSDVEETKPAVPCAEEEAEPAVTCDEEEAKPAVPYAEEEAEPAVTCDEEEAKPAVPCAEEEAEPAVTCDEEEAKPAVSCDEEEEAKAAVSCDEEEAKPAVSCDEEEAKPAVSCAEEEEAKAAVSCDEEEAKPAVSCDEEEAKPAPSDKEPVTPLAAKELATPPRARDAQVLSPREQSPRTSPRSPAHAYTSTPILAAAETGQTSPRNCLSDDTPNLALDGSFKKAENVQNATFIVRPLPSTPPPLPGSEILGGSTKGGLTPPLPSARLMAAARRMQGLPAGDHAHIPVQPPLNNALICQYQYHGQYHGQHQPVHPLVHNALLCQHQYHGQHQPVHPPVHNALLCQYQYQLAGAAPANGPYEGRYQGHCVYQQPGATPSNGLYKRQYSGQYQGQHQGQYEGQYQGQNSGQDEGQYQGQYSGQYQGRYPGQYQGHQLGSNMQFLPRQCCRPTRLPGRSQ
eukprot:gene16404-22611_t